MNTFVPVLALIAVAHAADPRYIPGPISFSGENEQYYKYVSDLKTGRTASEMGLPDTSAGSDVVYAMKYLPAPEAVWQSEYRYVPGHVSDGAYKYVFDSKTCRSDVEMNLPPLTPKYRYCSLYLPLDQPEGTSRYIPGSVSYGEYKYVVDTKTCRSAADMKLATPSANVKYCGKLLPVEKHH